MKKNKIQFSLTLTLALTLIYGCSSEASYECKKINNSGNVGSSCTQKTDCSEGFDCIDVYGCGYCSKKCAFDDPCLSDQNLLCVKLSGDMGNFCFEKCSGKNDKNCAQGLACTSIGESEIYVCFP